MIQKSVGQSIVKKSLNGSDMTFIVSAGDFDIDFASKISEPFENVPFGTFNFTKIQPDPSHKT